MNSILVVSADAEQTELVKAALAAEGLWVTEVEDRQQALRAAADQAPDLVVVDAEVAGAADLVLSFGSRNGGPGSLLIREQREPGEPPPDDEEGVDATLERPLDGDRLIRVVRKLLAEPRAAHTTPRASGRKFTAEEIFGDILREVEGLGPAAAPPALKPEPAAAVRRKEPVQRAAPPSPAPPKPAPDDRAEAAPEPSPAKPRETVPPPLVPPPAIAESEPVLADGPHRFGHYELGERIAVGGMAEIWKARMTGVEGFEKTVAIKKILPHLTESEDFEKMFVEEAKLAARLNHENIIHIYDLGKISGQYFIAMEYVQGKDLRNILNAASRRGERVPDGLAMLIGARLAAALDYAHRRPDAGGEAESVVHRDVSPRNILVGYDGRIKLCDFGVAKVASSVVQTQFGAIKGKIQYMSPEQAWGQPVDGRSDTFSLGAVLFEVATGERLFAGDSEVSLLDVVRECKPRDPKEVQPSIPDSFARIIRRALKKNPDERYATAGEMQREIEGVLYSLRPTPGADDLARYLETLSGEPSARPEPAAEEASSGVRALADQRPYWEEETDAGRRRAVLRYGLLAALLLAALVAVVAVWLSRSPEDASPPSSQAGPVATEPLEAGEPEPTGEPAPLPLEPAAAAVPQEPLPDAGAEAEAEIEDMVSRELARREAELRRLFQEEEDRLRQQLEELRVEQEEGAEPPPGEGEREPPGGPPPE